MVYKAFSHLLSHMILSPILFLGIPVYNGLTKTQAMQRTPQGVPTSCHWNT